MVEKGIFKGSKNFPKECSRKEQVGFGDSHFTSKYPDHGKIEEDILDDVAPENTYELKIPVTTD